MRRQQSQELTRACGVLRVRPQEGGQLTVRAGFDKAMERLADAITLSSAEGGASPPPPPPPSSY